MPKNVLEQIKHLCSVISTVEWSGCLFYSIDGSIKDPKNMVITLKDILPLDKGSSGFTSYEIDNRYVEYLMDDEERLEWHVGHIHSHHNMAVFFSGTDTEELHENSENHNLYLSLIVNNRLDFKAKLAFRAEAMSTTGVLPYIAKDENGNPFQVSEAEFKIKKEKLFVYDCDIEVPNHKPTVTEYFLKKVADILKPKHVTNYHNKGWKNKSNQGGNNWNRNKQQSKTKRLYPHSENALANQYSKKKVYDEQDNKAYKQFMKDFPFIDDDTFAGDENTYNVTPDKNPNLTEDRKPIEIMALELLNPLDFHIEADDDIHTLISLLLDDTKEMNGTMLAQHVVNKLPEVFERYYPEYDEAGNLFINKVEALIEIYEEGIQINPILEQVTEMLRAMIQKFEDYGTTV